MIAERSCGRYCRCAGRIRPGRPRVDDRVCFNAIVFLLVTADCVAVYLASWAAHRRPRIVGWWSSRNPRHTIVLLVSYVTMLHRSGQRLLPRLSADVAPATAASVCLAAAAVPAVRALSAAHAPAFPQLLIVGLTADAVYLLTLRVALSGASDELRSGFAMVPPRDGVRRPTLASTGAHRRTVG
jgi:hypothetical protein